MTPEQRVNFKRLMKPRHIAFVGGHDALVAIGEARRIGYPGKLWAVNPNRETLGGLPCFSSVTDLPQAPDAVFLAVPAQIAIPTVEKLRDMKAGGIVCYTAGFGELGEDGKANEQALIKAAGAMALVGPNCYGVLNYLDRTALWPFAHGGETPDYGCAVITQSGMLSSDLTMSQRSVPMTHMISIGNQSVLAIENFIDVLSEDNRVRAIGVHIEGLKDVSAFARAAIRAVKRNTPVVAFKTGSSAIGKSLTSSHTGSLSGEDNLYDALFQRCGVVRVYSPAELLETLKFLSISGVPKSPELAGFTCSGGGATMLADHAEKIGLHFPAFSETASEQLAGLLPDIATVSNPLDYTTPIWGQAQFTRPVFSAAIRTGVEVAILVQDYPAAGLDESKDTYLADGNAFTDAVLDQGIPAAICSTLPENLDSHTRNHFAARGVAPMQGINEALEAIAAACRWGDLHKRILNEEPRALITTGAPPCNTVEPTDEVTAKNWLKNAGISIPDGHQCTAADAPAAAMQLGFPVVLKMVDSSLMHKTEAGAVQTGLLSSQSVAAAVEQMQADVMNYKPDLTSDQFLVERNMPAPITELMVSVRWDTQFGWVLTLGSGGVLVELLDDVATVLWPASSNDLLDAIKSLKVYRLMNGFRGKPKADMDKLIETVVAIVQFARSTEHSIVDIEINPLFVYEQSCCVVDALIHIGE
ncbi:acyl-CoA synthetase [Chromatiales bacterium (ex Bugula neritina AB1)]|nr:acyl-CoA synthetase [Chromatiales bacterium (ex Bugula neritina AB1)]